MGIKSARETCYTDNLHGTRHHKEKILTTLESSLHLLRKNEPVVSLQMNRPSLRNHRLKFMDSDLRRITDRFRRIYRVYLKWMKAKPGDVEEPVLSYRWAGWVWEITCWSSWRLQEDYRLFGRIYRIYLWKWVKAKPEDVEEPVISSRWSGWIWEITGWSSWRLQEDYRSL